MYRNDNTGNVSEQPIEVNSELPSETGRASSSSSPGQPAASSVLEQPTTVPTTGMQHQQTPIRMLTPV